MQIAGRALLDGAVWAAIVGASAPAYALTASLLWLGTRAFPPAVFATLDALLYREYQVRVWGSGEWGARLPPRCSSGMQRADERRVLCLFQLLLLSFSAAS